MYGLFLVYMYRLVLCVALCSLTSAQPLSLYGGGMGLHSPYNSLQSYVPGRYPGSGLLGAGYNSQYYNPASRTAPILSYSNEKGPDGSYSFSFATGDGKQAQETGFLKDAFIDQTGSPQGTQVVEGSYSYTTPEGTPIQVRYIADENGFRPTGDHIPADGKGVLPGGVLPAGVLPGGVRPGLALGGAGYAGHLYNQGHNGYNSYNYGSNYNRNPFNVGGNLNHGYGYNRNPLIHGGNFNYGNNYRNPLNSLYNPIKY